MNISMRILVLMVLGFGSLLQAEDFQGSTHELEYDEEPVRYSASQPKDPVALLAKRIKAGEVKLAWDENFGYLPALLEVLQVPKSSQTLVFSKSSLQRSYISPQNPRALYFNDDIYLGFVPGAPLMEISAVDPTLGGIFYTLELERGGSPKFTRSEECMQCHGGQRSLGVPGHILRSVPTDKSGQLETQQEVNDIDHCTPLADRWAGWYVTGQHGAQSHRGNLIGEKDFSRHATEPAFRGNLKTLEGLVEPGKTLGEGSDIVALMVLQHQVHMHNYIARLNFEARQMTATYGHLRYLKSQSDAFLRYLLFTEEAPLTEAIAGNPQFVRDFTARGPRDHRGRSLRELDLQKRLFKYPCSFLISSEAFDSLLPAMRELLLTRLFGILSGADPDPQFAKIPEADRKAIREIVSEIVPRLPECWKRP